MKNIILQHWTGEMNELGELSSANISKYAEKIGADYKLLRGNVFRENLSSPCQKIYMLDEAFDEYDIVVMLDMDMFVRNGMEEDVFKDVEGIGRHTDIQDRLVKSLQRRFRNMGDPKYPYWGGSIYRIDRETRQELRKHINDDEIIHFSNNFEDEGIMHRLAVLSQMKRTASTYLPGNHWNCGSFESGVEKSAIIHIRTKVTPTGPKRAKIENYRALVKRGLIAE